MRLVCAAPLATLLLLLYAVEIRGHGRLRVPPSRASMWRDGFNTPINYNDNELFCGGNWYQNELNGGKCGVCGDPWGKPDPQFEAGGKYANGFITRTYTDGQEIDIAVEVTSQHGGFFEFRICPNNDFRTPVTHECLDRNLLALADGSGYRMYMGINDPVGFHNTTLRLPTGLSCRQCVLQWRWHTGNSWGIAEDGHSCIGCGAQEEFYGCSDVAIRPRDVGVDPPSHSQNITVVTTPRTLPPSTIQETTTMSKPAVKPSATTTTSTPAEKPSTTTTTSMPAVKPSTTTTTSTPAEKPSTTTTTSTPAEKPSTTTTTSTPAVKPSTTTTTSTPAVKPSTTTTTSMPAEKPSTTTTATVECVPAAGYEGNENVARWCRLNCPQNCPAYMCRCGPVVGPREVCKTTNVGPWKNANLDVWCARKCATGDCPSTHCMCVIIPA